jgi:hypothetical protein
MYLFKFPLNLLSTLDMLLKILKNFTLLHVALKFNVVMLVEYEIIT